jgi:hypothetical protein
MGANVGCFPIRLGLPRTAVGSASTSSLSRPAQASRMLRPAESLSRPMAAFVTRLQPGQLPTQAARQLPDQPTIFWVEPSSTGVTRLRGALLLKKLIARGDYATIESNGAPIRIGFCANGQLFESKLRLHPLKIFFQHYRPICDLPLGSTGSAYRGKAAATIGLASSLRSDATASPGFRDGRRWSLSASIFDRR